MDDGCVGGRPANAPDPTPSLVELEVDMADKRRVGQARIVQVGDFAGDKSYVRSEYDRGGCRAGPRM